MNYYGEKAWKPTAVIYALRQIRASKIKFDSFAVRGVSGLVFGAKLAHLMRKNLVVVRKEVTSHSGNLVEGELAGEYIFVDDFIGSGATRTAVQEGIARAHKGSKMVGQYLYCEERLWDEKGRVWIEPVQAALSKQSKRQP